MRARAYDDANPPVGYFDTIESITSIPQPIERTVDHARMEECASTDGFMTRRDAITFPISRALTGCR